MSYFCTRCRCSMNPRTTAGGRTSLGPNIKFYLQQLSTALKRIQSQEIPGHVDLKAFRKSSAHATHFVTRTNMAPRATGWDRQTPAQA